MRGADDGPSMLEMEEEEKGRHSIYKECGTSADQADERPGSPRMSDRAVSSMRATEARAIDGRGSATDAYRGRCSPSG